MDKLEIVSITIFVIGVLLVFFVFVSVIIQNNLQIKESDQTCKSIGYNNYDGDGKCISETSYTDVVMRCNGIFKVKCVILKEVD